MIATPVGARGLTGADAEQAQQAARPHELEREDRKAERDHHHGRTRREKHNGTDEHNGCTDGRDHQSPGDPVTPAREPQDQRWRIGS